MYDTPHYRNELRLEVHKKAELAPLDFVTIERERQVLIIYLKQSETSLLSQTFAGIKANQVAPLICYSLLNAWTRNRSIAQG